MSSVLKIKFASFFALVGLFTGSIAFAEEASSQQASPEILSPMLLDDGEFDSNDPNFERYFDETTGNPLEEIEMDYSIFKTPRCYRAECAVWANVSIAEQRLHLYVNGQYQESWKISSGLTGRTKTGDFAPIRIYDRYRSTKYPEGDYKGLGNMPYAVFYYGGFAIHGTTTGNIKKLGRPASHGCVRLHPDNAYTFNRLIRNNGMKQTWITVR